MQDRFLLFTEYGQFKNGTKENIQLIVISIVTRVPGQETDQRKLGERLWKKTVRHMD